MNYYDNTHYEIKAKNEIFIKKEEFQPYCTKIDNRTYHFSSSASRDSFIELQDEIKKEKEFESKIIRND